MSSVYVVILNWNGGADTVACLESLAHQTLRGLNVMVIDNGSEDDSIDLIRAWSAGAWVEVENFDAGQMRSGANTVTSEDARSSSASPIRLILLEAGQNLGFSAGSNRGIRYALEAGATYILLLNNDTVVAPDAVAHLVEFLSNHPEFVAATGQIRYSGYDRIWNCGGDLTWFGSRRYLYGEQPVELTPQSGWRPITFITGCAAMVRASTFAEHGLLTERFFFGEEDYEFSLRMKRAGCRMACCFDAVIDHKVGSSIDVAAPSEGLGRYYVYYLNRFIDMKAYYPRPFWWLWRWLTIAMVMPRLRRSRRLSWSSLATLTKRLIIDSARLDGVSQKHFESATRNGLGSLNGG